MYKENPERLSKIRELREQGHTIKEIAAITNYPPSTVGYYVTKYCGGKRRTRITQPARLPFETGLNRASLAVIPDYQPSRLESFLSDWERKYGLGTVDILEGKTKGDPLAEELIAHQLKEDPETLYFRLQIIKDLIILAPYLDINPERIRYKIAISIMEPKGDLATQPEKQQG